MCERSVGTISRRRAGRTGCAAALACLLAACGAESATHVDTGDDAQPDASSETDGLDVDAGSDVDPDGIRDTGLSDTGLNDTGLNDTADGSGAVSDAGADDGAADGGGGDAALDADRSDASADAPLDCPAQAPSANPTTTSVALWQRADLAAAERSIDLHLADTDCAVLRVAPSASWIHARLDGGTLVVGAVAPPPGLLSGSVAVLDDRSGLLLATFTVTARVFGAPDPAQSPKVLFVGIDGMRSDAFYAAETPVLDGLASIGAWTLDGRTHLGTTDSSVGWTTLYTSVGPDRHGVSDNGDTASRDWSYRSFSQIGRVDGGLQTAMAGHWATAVTTLHESDAFDQTFIGSDAEVAATIADWMATRDFDILTTQIDDVDHEGHSSGFSPANGAYLDVIETTDAHVGTMIDALLQRDTLANERWLIVVATDHGGEGTSHGAINLPNQRIPFVFSGSVPVRGAFESAVEQFDVAPTILAHLGIAPLAADRTEGIARLGPSEAVDPLATRPVFEAVCDDRIDQDGDRAIDCDDLDCDAALLCAAACVDGTLGSAVGEDVARGDSAGEDTDYVITCARLPGAADVSRSWIAPTTGRYTFTTVGSDYDTIMAVYRGECPRPRDQLACNDDTDGLLSSVTVDVAAGATYAVVVSGFDGETGNWQLNIEAAP